jgi:hypothetical protein
LLSVIVTRYPEGAGAGGVGLGVWPFAAPARTDKKKAASEFLMATAAP